MNQLRRSRAGFGRQSMAEGAAGCGHSLTCAVLDALSDQIAVLDRDGRIVAVNAAWRRAAAESGCDAVPSYLGDLVTDAAGHILRVNQVERLLRAARAP